MLTFWSQNSGFIVKLVWFLTIVQFLALTLYKIQTAKFPVVHKILWQIFTLFEDQGSHAIAKYSFQNRWKVTQERQSKDEANNGQGGWSFKNQLLFLIYTSVNSQLYQKPIDLDPSLLIFTIIIIWMISLHQSSGGLRCLVIFWLLPAYAYSMDFGTNCGFHISVRCLWKTIRVLHMISTINSNVMAVNFGLPGSHSNFWVLLLLP